MPKPNNPSQALYAILSHENLGKTDLKFTYKLVTSSTAVLHKANYVTSYNQK